MALVAGWLFLSRDVPVVFLFNPDAGAVQPRSYPVMNPFRDRGAEAAAERYLARLRDGDLEVLRHFASAHVREREAKYRILSWRIGRHSTDATRASLMYWVRRGGGYFDGEEEVFVELTRDGSGWKVTSFSAIY